MISVIILTQNESANLPACLSSLEKLQATFVSLDTQLKAKTWVCHPGLESVKRSLSIQLWRPYSNGQLKTIIN